MLYVLKGSISVLLVFKWMCACTAVFTNMIMSIFESCCSSWPLIDLHGNLTSALTTRNSNIKTQFLEPINSNGILHKAIRSALSDLIDSLSANDTLFEISLKQLLIENLNTPLNLLKHRIMFISFEKYFWFRHLQHLLNLLILSKQHYPIRNIVENEANLDRFKFYVTDYFALRESSCGFNTFTPFYDLLLTNEQCCHLNSLFHSQKLKLSGDIETNPGPSYNLKLNYEETIEDVFLFAASIYVKNYSMDNTLFSSSLVQRCENVGLFSTFDMCDCDDDFIDVIDCFKNLHSSLFGFVPTNQFEKEFIYCLNQIGNLNTIRLYLCCSVPACSIQFIYHSKIFTLNLKTSCINMQFPCPWAFDDVDINTTDLYYPLYPCFNFPYSITSKYDVFDDLTICGDVESNPGPSTHSKFCTDEKDKQQRQLIKSLQQQVNSLKKQQVKHDKYVQRQIELEKRDRQRNRKESSQSKAYAQGLFDFTNNCGTIAEDLAQTVGPSMNMVQSALQQLTEGMAEITKLFKIGANINLLDIIISIVSLGKALMEKSTVFIALYSLQLARQFDISPDDVAAMVPNFTEISETSPVAAVTYSGEPVAQSLLDDMLNVATDKTDLLPITGTLALFIGVFNLCCTGSIPSPANMTKHFGNVGRAAQGFRACKDLVKWLSDYIYELYYTSVYGMSKYDYDFMKSYPLIEELYAACKIITTLDKSLVDSSAPIADQILKIYQQLQEFSVSSAKVSDPRHKNVISNIMRSIKAHYDYALASPARAASVRKEPVTVYLYGEPGVGKSVMTEVLKARIFKKYLSDRGLKYENCSFSRKSENEYWEGYTNQPIVELDDFGNMKDSVNKPYTTFSELQYMVNTSIYPLNMATLTQKGNTNFTSEFIIASSNQLVPEVKSMVDAGAIYRRLHLCAEISICSDYGVPAGKKSNGDPYYVYNAIRAAQYLKIAPEAMNPLMFEHYRIKVYYIIFNKQTRQAEVVRPNLRELTFDEFWEYFQSVYEKRSQSNERLMNAIRKEAGLPPNENVETEAEILSRIEGALNPNILLDAVAMEKEKEDFKEAQSGSIDDAFSDAVESTSSFASIRKKLTIEYEAAKLKCKENLVSLWTKFCNGFDIVKSKFINIAQFFMSIFNNQTLTTYLPRVPTSQILTGICTTIIAVLGVWYSGLFCGKSSDYRRNWCRFIRSNDCSSVPCRKCSACQTIDFPSKGDIYEHFLNRIEVDQIYSSLCKLGVNEKTLRQKVSNLWRERNRQATELAQLQSRMVDETFAQHYDQQPIIPKPNITAQRIYDSTVLAKQPTNYAQKVYDTQPLTTKPGLIAQAYVDCLDKTEIHKDAVVYAQRDRVRIEQTTQVLLNNAVWIQAVNEEGYAARSNGVFIVGRTLLTTAHTILNPVMGKPVVNISIRNPYARQDHIMIPIGECKITQMKQLDGFKTDLILITFPPVVPNRPRILSKFIDAKSLGYLNEGNNMMFSGFTMRDDITIVHEYSVTDYEYSTRTVEYRLHENCPDGPECTHPIRIANTINYDLETKQGMCGAIISVDNKLIHTKLVGFHVAGGVGVLGIGSVTTRQFLEHNLDLHVEEHDIEKSYIIDGRLPYSQSYLDPAFKAKLIEQGDCISLGKAPKPNMPTLTTLSPSLIANKVQQSITKPAYLKPTIINGEKVDPMIKGIKKVLGPQVWIDPKLLEAAANDVFAMFAKRSEGSGIVHTYEEAIVGVDGDPYKRSINRTTSPGYPYNLTNKSKGKTKWLGSDCEFDLTNIELRNDVDGLIAMAKQGRRGDALSMATLKDEKRPIAKVDAGKTRVFEACPQHLVIAIRQYFLDFAAHIMRNRIDNGIAVGINPYSSEWTKLANHLLSKGNHMIAGDFSNFDGSLSMQVLVKICDKINEWYAGSDEDNLIRSVLWEHICNADVVVFDDVIRQTHSQPSGNPLTVIINSIFNAIVMRIAYLKLKQKQGLPAYCDYRNYVSEIVYGDDDIKSVHESILPWFNQVTLTEALSEIGLTYTDETKSGTVVPWKPLSEVAFLKRAFAAQSDGFYLAPMEITNVLEITNWIKGKAKRAATVENCEAAISELVLHGQDEYNFWSKRIQQECLKVGLALNVPTFHEQWDLYLYNERCYDQAEYIPLW